MFLQRPPWMIPITLQPALQCIKSYQKYQISSVGASFPFFSCRGFQETTWSVGLKLVAVVTVLAGWILIYMLPFSVMLGWRPWSLHSQTQLQKGMNLSTILPSSHRCVVCMNTPTLWNVHLNLRPPWRIFPPSSCQLNSQRLLQVIQQPSTTPRPCLGWYAQWSVPIPGSRTSNNVKQVQ